MNTGRYIDARELKRRASLTDIVGRFTRLRRSGRQYVGLCPFHRERHASFYVHPEKHVFYCFGCGAGGDIFAFVMRATGCDFRRALETVAGWCAGVVSESEPRSGERFRANKGDEVPSAREAGVLHSQLINEGRVRALDVLAETEKTLARIAVTNARASAALATACEPDRLVGPLLEKTGQLYRSVVR
jgi:DNA primase